MSSIGLVNTQNFREAAIYFDKYKQYDCGRPGTMYYREFWKEERRRCREGYSAGGITISGYHYHYLNHTRIQIVEETYKEVHDTKATNARKSGQRKESFPRFWDVDYAYFTSLEIAENGISFEDYLKLPIVLNINKNSLGGGSHILWLKPRGVGASWKAASMAARNFGCVMGSFSYMLANDKTFLTEDGLWSKFLGIKDWQIANSPGIGKLSEFKKDRSNMHFRASVDKNGVESGYKSEVIGVSLNNDWQKARGKRGKLILWEEAGKFPNMDLAWEVARPSVEEGDTVYGLMVAFGTGGTKNANFEALKKMYYDPRSYNLLCFDDIYSEGYKDGDLGAMFTPAYKNIQFIDKDGNSNQPLAKEYFLSERLQAEKAKDQTLLPRKKAENPFTPQEAVLVTGKNIFITDLLIEHAKKVEALGLYKSFPTAGRFERKEFSLKFVVDVNCERKAVYKFPHNLNENLEGAVLIYHNPYRKNDLVPKDLYKICVDTYEHDTTTGDSLGAIYVIEQSNNFTPTRGDIIAASFIGRPDTQEEFNKVLFELAEYYNAEIAYENDKPGDVVGYAKRHKKLNYLADEFELAYDEELKTSERSTRHFGMSMNSGKENKRKKQGDIYSKNWIYTLRSGDEDTGALYNFNTVYDLGLLQEWIHYDIDANRDRQSAFRVGMYHQQELLYNEVVPEVRRTKDSKTTYFSKQLF